MRLECLPIPQELRTHLPENSEILRQQPLSRSSRIAERAWKASFCSLAIFVGGGMVLLYCLSVAGHQQTWYPPVGKPLEPSSLFCVTYGSLIAGAGIVLARAPIPSATPERDIHAHLRDPENQAYISEQIRGFQKEVKRRELLKAIFSEQVKKGPALHPMPKKWRIHLRGLNNVFLEMDPVEAREKIKPDSEQRRRRLSVTDMLFDLLQSRKENK